MNWTSGQSVNVSYPISSGPVKIQNTTGNIIASQRVAYNNGTAWTSFSEVMGLPANQATTAYYFPWYNNVDLNTQIRFANLGSTPANVWVTIGGVVQPPIPLSVGESTRVSYPINNGPVKVESSMGNIIASMRAAYKDGSAWTNFSEVLGVPANQATAAYYFPWYNNTGLNTQIRFRQCQRCAYDSLDYHRWCGSSARYPGSRSEHPDKLPHQQRPSQGREFGREHRRLHACGLQQRYRLDRFL